MERQTKNRQEVIEIEKKKECSFKMEPTLVEELDKRYSRLGYATRSDLFTAFAYAIIDRLKTKEDDLIFTCAKDLKGNMPKMTEHQIEKHLDDLIGSMFKPVIAMRDSDVACKAGTHDILEEYYARYRIFLTEEEVKHAFRRYELMHKSSLREYRIQQMKKRYENTPAAAQPQIQQPQIHPETDTPDTETKTPQAPIIRANGEFPNEMH